MLKKALLMGLVLSFSGAAGADRLLIEKVEAARNADLPRHGSSMAQVEGRFGEPDNRMPAVGEPPITRWVYSDFTVYFEHQYVIDSVTHVRTASTENDSG